MIGLLARLFIKDYNDVKNPDVRGRYGVLCGIAGICFNFLLFSGKFIAGIFSKSVAVIADAFNNLSDAAASIVTIVGFKISGKKPDADHPFGHGRMEYIAGLVVSFLILVVGFELLMSSIDSIRNPEPLDTSVFTVVMLVAAILVKFYMFFYNRRIGKKILSSAMEATAKDSLNDTVSTAVVLAAVIIELFFPNSKFPFDGVAGIFVAVFIFYNGIESIKDTVNPLLGVPADREFVKQVEEEVMKFKPICGIHDLIVHDYGPGRVMISLHAEFLETLIFLICTMLSTMRKWRLHKNSTARLQSIWIRLIWRTRKFLCLKSILRKRQQNLRTDLPFTIYGWCRVIRIQILFLMPFVRTTAVFPKTSLCTCFQKKSVPITPLTEA